MYLSNIKWSTTECGSILYYNWIHPINQSFNHGGSCKACCANVLKCRPGTELFVVGVEEVGELGDVSGTIDAIAFWH